MPTAVHWSRHFRRTVPWTARQGGEWIALKDAPKVLSAELVLLRLCNVCRGDLFKEFGLFHFLIVSRLSTFGYCQFGVGGSL